MQISRVKPGNRREGGTREVGREGRREEGNLSEAE